jgi:hypothetical protein
MLEIKHNRTKLTMYDSIEEIPITRFQIYNMNVMIDAGIGGDVDAFDQRCNNLRNLIVSNPDQAIKEVLNMQQNVRFVMAKADPKMYSFVSMIHKINGRLLQDDDLTEAGMQKIIAELGAQRLPVRRVFAYLVQLKKKLMLSLTRFSQN